MWMVVGGPVLNLGGVWDECVEGGFVSEFLDCELAVQPGIVLAMQ